MQHGIKLYAAGAKTIISGIRAGSKALFSSGHDDQFERGINQVCAISLDFFCRKGSPVREGNLCVRPHNLSEAAVGSRLWYIAFDIGNSAQCVK
jgi:hypothetical protein